MEDWYPDKLIVSAKGTPETLKQVLGAFEADAAFHYAEFGIYEASTALSILEACPNAQVSLFDFDHTIDKARKRLAAFQGRVHFYGNSQRHLDSYNWALALLIRDNPEPIFDYVFLDGAHTYAVDALTFFLCDRLLKVGGYADFDDYGWRLRGSSIDPTKVPVIAEQYTDAQIDAYQVKMIVDDLVKRDPRYEEVMRNKVYRKVA
ncbi:MAG: hypothetical protein QNJ20_18205 [Paracoccaceae bacterium]|nr:hypothetical protein [Paracoccaceae bacterium]